jgi:hypothetical protein
MVAVCGCQIMSDAEAACFPIMAIVIAGHGCSPLKALVAPLVAAFDAPPGHDGR